VFQAAGAVNREWSRAFRETLNGTQASHHRTAFKLRLETNIRLKICSNVISEIRGVVVAASVVLGCFEIVVGLALCPAFERGTVRQNRAAQSTFCGPNCIRGV
jgi:hypothetical protein